MTGFFQKLRSLFRRHKPFPKNRFARVGLHMNDAKRGIGK